MTSLTVPVDRVGAADLRRQAHHWVAAAQTFRDAEEFATVEAWRSVEREVGLPLRTRLATTVEELLTLGQDVLALTERASHDDDSIDAAAQGVQLLRRRYAQVETTLDFFGDAVNSRTSPSLRRVLTTLDLLANASMTPPLKAAGAPVPAALVYVDKGMGASILRAGIRLWAPGAVNPVAAIKIVRHNLYRPTSLFHECGHQVAALTGWTESVRAALDAALADDPQIRSMWTPWSSEIVADVFAFLVTGHASVSALYDVVGDRRTILRWPLGDPHPVGWLRTLLGCALSRRAFGGDGAGPWDALEASVTKVHPLSDADPSLVPLIERSRERLPEIAALCLQAPVPGLGGCPMTRVLDPARVSPAALSELERTAGPALWTSPHWRDMEGVRAIALAGLREAERPDRAAEWTGRVRDWMASATAAA